MPDFIFAPPSSFTRTCVIHAAGERGDEKLKIDLTFKRLPQAAINALQEALVYRTAYESFLDRQKLTGGKEQYDGEVGKTTREALHEVVVGWGVVKTPDGERIEFSHENLDKLLDAFPGSTNDLLTQYFEFINAGRRKN